MTAAEVFIRIALLLFALGLFGVIALLHPLRKVIALNLMSGGVFLFLVSTAGRVPGAPPDPVPHAMVLTGVVVSICATAMALAMIRRIHRRSGETHLHRAKPDEPPGETSK